MNTYVILRRSGWRSPQDLQEAAGRSKQVGDEEMSEDIRWIRSYVLEEDGGELFIAKGGYIGADGGGGGTIKTGFRRSAVHP